MKKWMVQNKKADFNMLARECHIDPVVARIIRNRGLEELNDVKRYLYGNENDLYDAHLLKDADKLVSVLKQKIDEGKKIRIIGDYDTDGVTSCYQWMTALMKVGANVSYYIPERMTDGYGLN